MTAADLDTSRLGDWLAEHVPGFSTPFTAAKFAGGQSNPTYRIDTASNAFVLRRRPFGTLLPSAHAVDREYRLISALKAQDFPVPRTFAFCGDTAIIGSEFYVMELVEGRVHWDGCLPDLSGAARRKTYHGMIDSLAALHRIDIDTAGLADFGKRGEYFQRQIRRWISQYRATQTDDIPEIERLIDWLPRTIPEQSGTSVVHGDYRIDNIIFSEDNDVLAVLDWELATLGDPLADFSYLALNWIIPANGGAGLGGVDIEGLEIPSLEEAIDRYYAASGQRGPVDLSWYFAFNLFRLVAIIQGIKKRHLEGNASSAEADLTIARIPGLVRLGWDYAVMAGAKHSVS